MSITTYVFSWRNKKNITIFWEVVGWCEGVLYLTLGSPTDIGLVGQDLLSL